VTIAVTLNATVASIGSATGATDVIGPGLLYAAKELKEFRKKGKLSSITIGKITKIGSFIAAAAAKSEISSLVGLSVPKSINGLPDFNDYVAPIKGAVFIPLTGRRTSDKVAARARRSLPNNANHTWHHHESPGIMMLVRRPEHIANGHSGGVLFWEILNNKEYRD
jgi:hypothetical protein